GPHDQARLAAGVQSLLDGLQADMTTYDADSELMRLNRAPQGEWLPVSTDLFRVLEIAREVYAWTDGAFDPGVGELVNLWGFGPPAVDGLPAEADMQAAYA